MPRHLIHMLVIVSLVFGLAFPGFATAQAVTHLHHVFPQQFESYFASHGINIHLWTIPLDQRSHNALHAMGYNQRWQAFIALQPKTTQNKIFLFATALLGEMGVRSRLTPHNYKTRQPTGKDFPPKEISAPILLRLQNFAKSPQTIQAIRLVSKTVIVGGSVVLAWEIYKIFSAMDSDFVKNSFAQDSLVSFAEALDLHNRDLISPALSKLGEAYFQLGYACYQSYLQATTTFHKEIADHFTRHSDLYFTHAERFFTKSMELNDSIPHAYLYLGILKKERSQQQEAIKLLHKAKLLFAGDQEFETIIDGQLKTLGH